MSVKSKMTALADAIRSKSGKTGSLTIDGMISAVNSIVVGSGSTSPSGDSIFAKSECGEFTLSSDVDFVHRIDHSLGVVPDYFYLYMDNRSTEINSNLAGYVVELTISRRTYKTYTELFYECYVNSSGSIVGSASGVTNSLKSNQISMLFSSTDKLKSGVKYRWIAGTF